MDIFFIIVATIIILAAISSSRKQITRRLECMEAEFRFLRERLKHPEEKKEQAPVKEEVMEQEPIREYERYMPHFVEEEEVVVQEPLAEIPVEEMPVEEEAVEMIWEAADEKEETKPEVPVFKPEKKKDYEKLIGENLLSKIGIATLVLGIGYFVKYAIDQNWINEIGRVALGILCGGIIMAIAHKLKDKYRTFSSILVGGGISVLYITVTIAFQDYGIFSQTLSFAFLILITGLAVFLSILYDRKELAIFSLLGGFASPLMVSSGAGNYVVLFSYIFILNTGMLILSFKKGWKILGWIAYILTQAFYWIWLLVLCSVTQQVGAVVFIFLFYIQFYLLALIDHYQNKKEIHAFHVFLILSNNLSLFAACLFIFRDFPVNVKGLISIALAVFNAVPLIGLFKDKTIDKRVIYLLIALVLTFVSLAIPIQLNGHAITLFWAAETVILLWLWQKSRIRIFETGFIIIEVLVLISLLMDWIHFYEMDYLPVIFNKAFITGLAITATFYINAFLLKRDDPTLFPEIPQLKKVFSFFGLGLLFLTLLLELQYQMNIFYSARSFQFLIYLLYVYLFAAIFTLIRWNKKNYLDWLYVALIVFVVSYVLVYVPVIYGVVQEILHGRLDNWGYFSMHYPALPVVVLFFVFLLQKKKDSASLDRIYWLIAVTSVIIISTEADNLLLFLFHNGSNRAHLLNISHNIVYPVLWGIASFALMIIGMKQKNRALRIISLSLFALIIAKLYLYDIWKMGQTGRIIALIFLGILFLAVSFLYQKLKILLKKEDEPEEEKRIEN